METIILTGISGRIYPPYSLFRPDATWNPLPGNYGFGFRSLLGASVLYLGETDNFANRPLPPKHERWLEAVRLGATHIFARVNPDPYESRKDEERDLIAAYQPVLNAHHRNALAELLRQG